MKVLSFLIAIFSLLVFPAYANASENWVVEDFKSEIDLQKDGKVQISEEIEVDFASLEKHGIYRDIPIVYSFNDGSKLYTKIEVQNVTSNRSYIPYEAYRSGDYEQIKIGDPDETVSGKQTYEISYLASGVLRSYEDHDELFWNVTGNAWPVPIESVSATVTLPGEGITQITCYEGAYASKNLCSSNQKNETEALFTTKKSLSENENLTVVVGYTKGLVPIITVPPPKDITDDLFTLTNLATFLIAFGLGLGSAALTWWRRGRDFWWRRGYLGDPGAKKEVRPIGAHETIVVEYGPPEKLRPAEVGVLIDERADTLDVTATIIDLATRGYLTITEVPKKWVFGSTDYTLKRLKRDTGALLGYEKELLSKLFDGKDEVEMSSLKTKFYKDLKAVKNKLYEEIVGKGFFPENPEKVRMKYMLVGVGADVLGGALVVIGIVLTISLLVAFGAGIFASCAFWFLFAIIMPRKTAHGREMYRRSRGYELFISKAEKYRQRFFEKKNMFNEILPYAIVFGQTEKFAKSFAGMGLDPQSHSWYVGSRPFNAAVFGAHVASFTGSLSSAMAAAPGGSGFGGGGFSGGGFGGGGGGSW